MSRRSQIPLAPQLSVRVPTYGPPLFPQQLDDDRNELMEQDESEFGSIHEETTALDDEVECAFSTALTVHPDVKEMVLTAFANFQHAWYGEATPQENKKLWRNLITDEHNTFKHNLKEDFRRDIRHHMDILDLKTTSGSSSVQPNVMSSKSRHASSSTAVSASASGANSPASSNNTITAAGYYYPPWNIPVIGDPLPLNSVVNDTLSMNSVLDSSEDMDCSTLTSNATVPNQLRLDKDLLMKHLQRESQKNEIQAEKKEKVEISTKAQHVTEKCHSTQQSHGFVPLSVNDTQKQNRIRIAENGAWTEEDTIEDSVKTDQHYNKRLLTQQSFGFVPISVSNACKQNRIHVTENGYDGNTKLSKSDHTSTDRASTSTSLVMQVEGFTHVEPPGYVLSTLSISEDNSNISHDLRYRCKMCEFATHDEPIIQDHMKTHSGIFKCPENECGGVFQFKCSLVDHIHNFHSANPNGEEVGYTVYQQSDNQSIKDTDAADTSEHSSLGGVWRCGCSSSSALSEEHLSSCSTAVYACLSCDETFLHQKHLRYHVKKHEKTRFKCNMCPYISVHRSAMLGHLRTHSDERNFKCSLCDLAFRYKSNLKEHIRIHTGEKPYSCSQCDRTFHQSGQLKMHMVTHTGEKPYKCNLCPQAFKRNDGLRAHHREHTGEMLKCDQCDYTTRIDRRLSEHKRWHSGNIYKCQSCAFTSIHKCNMKKHMQIHAQPLKFKEYRGENLK